jgi:glutathione synthase/RimK-type ligase-like ATP-grasp enzyme
MAPPSSDILVVGGADATRSLKVGRNAVDLQGINDSRILLHEAGYRFEFFLLTPNYFKRPLKISPSKYRVILNVVSDADQNPKVLEVLDRVLRDQDVSVLNRPAPVMGTTREKVAARLADVEGLTVPKTLRLLRSQARFLDSLIAETGFRFPAIVRPVGMHGGIGSRLVRTAAEVEPYLKSVKSLYLTEFADYRNKDGFFRKYRCYLIGDQAVFRHLIISDHWCVHARDKERVMFSTPWMLEEEKQVHDAGIDYFTASQKDTLFRIKSVLGLDYFGVDFSITKSGRLVLFEANATMNFFPFLNPDPEHYSRQPLARAVRAMRELVGRSPAMRLKRPEDQAAD